MDDDLFVATRGDVAHAGAPPGLSNLLDLNVMNKANSEEQGAEASTLSSERSMTGSSELVLSSTTTGAASTSPEEQYVDSLVEHDEVEFISK